MLPSPSHPAYNRPLQGGTCCNEDQMSSKIIYLTRLGVGTLIIAQLYIEGTAVLLSFASCYLSCYIEHTPYMKLDVGVLFVHDSDWARRDFQLHPGSASNGK